MFNKKYYNFKLKIKKINKLSKNKFNKIKEYEYEKNKIKTFILGIGGRAKLIRELLIRINDKHSVRFYKDISSINFKKKLTIS